MSDLLAKNRLRDLDMGQFVQGLRVDLVNAVDKYREAKLSYKWVTESYTCDDDGMEITDEADLVDAKIRASRDPQQVTAVKECEFWSNEAIMYATAIEALREK